MAIVRSVYKTRNNIVSSVYKTRSNVISSVYRTASNVVKSVYKTKGTILRSVIKTSVDIINEGVTSYVTEDLSTLVIHIEKENFSIANIGKAAVTLFDSQRVYSLQIAQDGDVVSISVPIDSDGVYFLNVEDEAGVSLVIAPLLVTSRINRRFTTMNNKVVANPVAYNIQEWLTIYSYYRGVRANFRTRRYTEAMSLIEYLEGIEFCGGC